MIDIASIKQQFPIFAQHEQTGTPLHYLDNAATAHKPQSVIDAVCQCYASDYGPVARGLYPLAERATEAYEAARRTIAGFIGAEPNTVVFTSGATASLNMVAEGAIKPHLKAGDEVWVTQVEHHSNYLPWLRVCGDTGATLRVLEIDKHGKLVLPPLSELKSGKVKCVALSLVSNVLGYYADVAAIVSQAKAAGITTVVDAAQAMAHHPVNAEQLGCDFLAFSGHKMFGPTGVGALYIAPGKTSKTQPLLVGGGMVDWVGETIDMTQWSPGIVGLEAGSPNLAGVVGMAKAAEFIQQLDRDAIEAHIAELAVAFGNTLGELPGYTVFGDESNWYAGLVTFAHEFAHPHDIAQVCGDRGVAIRAGHHCAQPLMTALGHPATARASFSIYNHSRDAEALVMALVTAAEMFA